MVRLIKRSLIATLLLLNFASFYVSATMLNIGELRQGWMLYKLDKFEQAAKIWENNSLTFLNEERNQQKLRVAALAQILASLSYEKNNDKSAYQAWATGQIYLLESNISWLEFSKKIKKRRSI